MTRHIRAHFDGRVLVPDQPVDLPVNQPLEVEVMPLTVNGTANGPTSTATSPDADLIRRRLGGLDALNGLIPGPVISLEALRRENLYDERS